MTQGVKDKQIIIAGASSGIGRALAIMLAAEKAQVTAIGRDQQKLTALAAEAPGIRTVALDLRDRKALDDFFSKQGPIDHLVLTVGDHKGIGNFSALSLSELREGFENKFWPQLETIQSALLYMNTTGSITLVTSISATVSLAGTAGLGAINGALQIMVPVLANELRPLRVNAVSPGLIDTPWWDFLPAEGKQGAFESFTSKIAVGRPGKAEEVADAIRLVMTNPYIDGSVIGCHGGIGV